MLRTFLIFAAVVSTVVAAPAKQNSKRGDEDDWLSPVFKNLYSKPLHIPPVLETPLTTYTNATTGETFKYYEVTIEPFQKEVYPGKLTNFVGYNGMAPGPTIKAYTGSRNVVRFINKSNNPSAIHLHGSPSRPPFDGWAEDTIKPNHYKDYIFPNVGGRTLWYHDHAMHETAVNAFYGQAGFYLLEDTAKENALDLPRGKYDIPLSIVDRIYRSDYQLKSPASETDSYFGDIIHVNGVPWPYLNVEPRKYRFRMCDMSLSRSYKVSLQTSTGTKVPITVIGTDAGFIQSPVKTNDLILAIAERYEVIIDFSAYAGKTLTLKNARDYSKNDDFAKTDQIMQFRVGTTVTSQAGNGPIPAVLNTLTWPTKATNRIDRSFKFERNNGMWTINGVVFSDFAKRVLAKPTPGSTEIWELENSSGGWGHPVHIHLVDFKVLTRSGNGRGVMPYENGFKDVVWLDTNEKVTVIAKFQPWKGEYMFHCHNLIHEDHDMMAEFDVADTRAKPNQGDEFSNPLAPAWRDKPIAGPTDLVNIATVHLPWISGLNVYTGYDQFPYSS